MRPTRTKAMTGRPGKETIQVVERRQHKRYPPSGQAVFRTAGALEGDGQAINIALAGLLLGSVTIPPKRTQLWIHFTIPGHSGAFIAAGRVVHTQAGLLGVEFLQEPVGLRELLKSQEF